jgi:hypothetical protein
MFAACGDDAPEDRWFLVHDDLDGALMSVWGSAADDVWAVGARGAAGDPTVMHFDGAAWETLPTGETGDLWWVFGFDGGPVYMGGTGGMILRYEGGNFTRMTTPGTNIVFGIWGSSETDLWAVGGAGGGSSGAFAWRLDTTSDEWVDAPGFPAGLAESDAMWKVWGRSAHEVWIVGTRGKMVSWDGSAFTEVTVGGESLFTVHADGDRFAAVGGIGGGVLLENDGLGAWTNATPDGAPGLVGVALIDGGNGWAAGQYGFIYRRTSAGWAEDVHGITLNGLQSFHAVWVDPEGGVWMVGGEVTALPLVNGVMIHRGPSVPGGER